MNARPAVVFALDGTLTGRNEDLEALLPALLEELERSPLRRLLT